MVISSIWMPIVKRSDGFVVRHGVKGRIERCCREVDFHKFVGVQRPNLIRLQCRLETLELLYFLCFL